MKIVLTTLNARYYHSALGLRYLKANLDPDLQSNTEIVEFTIKHPIKEVAQRLLALSPKLIGIGVYIWNRTESLELIHHIKSLSPDTLIVMGGPEISFETSDSPFLQAGDILIRGEGEHAFAKVCRALSTGDSLEQIQTEWDEALSRHHVADLSRIHLPYTLYNTEDIAHRTLYVESSRGCPFRCEFCLSSLSPAIRKFPLTHFFTEIEALILRGARKFKFIDRSFNLEEQHALDILDFFESRWQSGMQLHLEVVPDRFSNALLQKILSFPSGGLHLEVGIQSFDSELLRHISRFQDKNKTISTIEKILSQSGAEVHADLIFGLPGQNWAHIVSDFETLFSLSPHEIQLGILKKLKGAPIARHDSEFKMHYSSTPPYEIIETSLLDHTALDSLKQFAKIFETLHNGNRFPNTMNLIRTQRIPPFELFMAITQDFVSVFERTYALPLFRVTEQFYRALCQHTDLSHSDIAHALYTDFYSDPGRKEKIELFP